MCVCVCVCVSVLEADVVADLAGGAYPGLREEQFAVGTHTHLEHGLPAPRGGGLALGQAQQADPLGVQGDLEERTEHTTGTVLFQDRKSTRLNSSYL